MFYFAGINIQHLSTNENECNLKILKIEDCVCQVLKKKGRKIFIFRGNISFDVHEMNLSEWEKKKKIYSGEWKYFVRVCIHIFTKISMISIGEKKNTVLQLRRKISFEILWKREERKKKIYRRTGEKKSAYTFGAISVEFKCFLRQVLKKSTRTARLFSGGVLEDNIFFKFKLIVIIFKVISSSLSKLLWLILQLKKKVNLKKNYELKRELKVIRTWKENKVKIIREDEFAKLCLQIMKINN